MADPRPGLDLTDIVGLAVTATLMGMGGAMAWFNRSKQKIHDRLDLVENEMKEIDKRHGDHSTQLAVVQTCQENTAQRLEKIDETTRDTNNNLKDLGATMTQVLLAIKSQH